MAALPKDERGAGESLDAIELLQADHREIEHLFFRLEPSGALGSREIFDRLSEVLAVHSVIEKEVFYPAVRSALAGGDDLVKEALFDHEDVAMSLERLRKVTMGGDEFTIEILSLAGRVRTHVRKEEYEIFPALRKTLTEHELTVLAEKLLQAARHAPSRPHPHAPKSALGSKIAGRLIGPVDRLRDYLRQRV